MTTCSIIIPVYNHAMLTRQCVNTLLTQPPRQAEQEIIIVDDGSRDLTPQLLTGYGGQIRVVTHATNAGFAVSSNDGAAAAMGDYLVFLNNDTIPIPGWLDALVDYAEKHPRAAAVGSRLLFPNHTVQHAGVIIGQDRQPRHLYAGFPGDHPAVTKSRRFQVVTAACVLIRRRVFEEAQGFDTAFCNGFEDVDLCLRLGELGYEIHYCHESVLCHLEGPTRGFNKTETGHNVQLYCDRWYDRVRPDDVQYYIEDGLLQFDYPDRYPIHLSVDPHLVVINQGKRERQTERLIEMRARQVADLLKENVRLGVRLYDTGLSAPFSSGEAVCLPSTEAQGPSPGSQDALGAALSPEELRPVDLALPTSNGFGHLIKEISPNDEVFGDQNVDHYLRAGYSALRCIRLALLAAEKEPPGRILDFPCGHGRVTRMLKAAFPDAYLTACDFNRDGVDFCARTFGATPVYAKDNPGEIEMEGQFDFIWCGSLFSHLGAERWPDFLSLLHSLLAPGGLLVFSTHGRGVERRIGTGNCDGIEPDQARVMLADYQHSGFGYQDYGVSPGYGISLSSLPWVLTELNKLPHLRLVMCQEQGWDSHQDVLAYLRREPNL